MTKEEIEHYSSALANISKALNDLNTRHATIVNARKLALNQNSKWIFTKDSYPIADQLGWDWEGGRSELVLCEDKHGCTYVARYYGGRLGYGTWECRSGEIITDVIIKWRELPID